VRLKNGYQLAIANDGSGRFDRGRDFGWVVSKIIVNLDAASLAVELEASLGAAKFAD
jgi:hypothetical protein